VYKCVVCSNKDSDEDEEEEEEDDDDDEIIERSSDQGIFSYSENQKTNE